MTAERTSRSVSAQATSKLDNPTISRLDNFTVAISQLRHCLLTVVLLAVLPSVSGAAPVCAETTPASALSSDTITIDSLAHAIVGAQKREKPRFLQGAAIGGDLLGLGLKVMGSDWRQLEAFFRLNLYDEYYPIFELGIGEADHEGQEIENRFHIRAPYFRLGCDYNFANKKHSGNRVLGGIRYGYSSYNYDYTAPDLVKDPVWHTAQAVAAHDLSGHLHWIEFVVGVETKMWRIVRLGWDIRAKMRIQQKAPDQGEPWFFPGFGKNTEGLVWGGSFKLVFDI